MKRKHHYLGRAPSSVPRLVDDRNASWQTSYHVRYNPFTQTPWKTVALAENHGIKPMRLSRVCWFLCKIAQVFFFAVSLREKCISLVLNYIYIFKGFLCEIGCSSLLISRLLWVFAGSMWNCVSLLFRCSNLMFQYYYLFFCMITLLVICMLRNVVFFGRLSAWNCLLFVISMFRCSFFFAGSLHKRLDFQWF